MKYLIRDPNTNVVEIMFEQPVTPGGGLEVIPVSDQQFRDKMLGSIFIDVNNYKPRPQGDYWVSDGTNWNDSRTDEEVWEAVRLKRDEELAQSDWTQLADADLNPAEVTQWANYRAAVRAAVANTPVNNPRAAEAALNAEEQNRPGRNDTDPRRGRGRGNRPVRPNRVR